jgi:hypothetical protein
VAATVLPATVTAGGAAATATAAPPSAAAGAAPGPSTALAAARTAPGRPGDAQDLVDSDDEYEDDQRTRVKRSKEKKGITLAVLGEPHWQPRTNPAVCRSGAPNYVRCTECLRTAPAFKALFGTSPHILKHGMLCAWHAAQQRELQAGPSTAVAAKTIGRPLSADDGAQDIARQLLDKMAMALGEGGRRMPTTVRVVRRRMRRELQKAMLEGQYVRAGFKLSNSTARRWIRHFGFVFRHATTAAVVPSDCARKARDARLRFKHLVRGPRDPQEARRQRRPDGVLPRAQRRRRPDASQKGGGGDRHHRQRRQAQPDVQPVLRGRRHRPSGADHLRRQNRALAAR